MSVAKKKELSDKELFEDMPVARAVATLAIPTVISQVVTMIYNLADTFFVGQIGDPLMVAAYGVVKRIDQFPLNVSMGLYPLPV